MDSEQRQMRHPVGAKDLAFPTKPLSLADIDARAVKRCIAGAREGRQWNGYFEVFDGKPLLAFFTDTDLVAKVPRFFAYGWQLELGASLTITAIQPGIQGSRVLIPADAPVLDAFENGVFRAVFIRDGDVERACEVDLHAQSGALDYLLQQLDLVKTYKPRFGDPVAHRCEMLRQVSKMWPALPYSREARAAVAWVKTFRHHVFAKVEALAPLAPQVAALELSELPELLRASFGQFGRTGDLAVMMRAAAAASAHDGGIGWYNTTDALDARDDWRPFLHLVTAGWLLHMVSAEATRNGTRLPWLNGPKTRLDFIDLDLKTIESKVDLFEYWRRIPCLARINWGLMVNGGDVPASPLIFEERAQEMPRSEDVEATQAASNALLDEAVHSKQWTIPPNAFVQLTVGPFVELELMEVPGDVAVLLRTDDGQFYFIGVEPAKKYWSFHPRYGQHESTPELDSVVAAVELLLAAVVRDFWVVERRESAFITREVRYTLGRDSTAGDGPRVVYLPRIRYSPHPDLRRCRQELGQPERRQHQVGAHLRKAHRTSAVQVELARIYGFSIPHGYTFVRPHERGAQRRDIIYRSRSALRSLFASDDLTSAAPVRWFKFERDVRDVLISMGFEVEHVAASRRGDRGVDVYAHGGKTGDGACWIIQCKCWSASRKVGPDVVRELIGALSAYPAGTRGMVVTTSSFTSGAVAESERAGIQLMDGDEFAALTKRYGRTVDA